MVVARTRAAVHSSDGSGLNRAKGVSVGQNHIGLIRRCLGLDRMDGKPATQK